MIFIIIEIVVALAVTNLSLEATVVYSEIEIL